MTTNDYLSLFPSASQERPRLMALARALLQQVDDLAALVESLPASVSIASAVGRQLDQQAAAFGLSRADTIAGPAVSDADFRTFLLAKLALWDWDGKNDTVPAVLAAGLPGSTLTDNLDGTVNVVQAQPVLVPRAELFPVPAGIRAIKMTRNFTPSQIQTIVTGGQARKYFNIGDIIIIPWTDYTPSTPVTYQYPFVVAHIGDVVDDQQVTHHDALYLMAMYAVPQAVPFDAPEQVKATESTFQANMYYYIKSGSNWVEQTVTAGDPIPGGTTYYKHYRTGMATRIRYGSNNYQESAIRQWLNSSGGKGEWWTAQHESDVGPSQRTSVPGFLTGFTEDWLAIFKPVEVKCFRNTSCDGGGWDTMYDRFFLPSLEEMYGEPQLSGEGVYWEYWKEETGLDSPSNGSASDTNDARKIPSAADPTGSAVTVRLRSAGRTAPAKTCVVSSEGYMLTGNASGSYRAQPACVIY